MDSTLDHSHLATEVQLGENELHMRKQCDTYAKQEIRTDTTLESHGKLYAKVSQNRTDDAHRFFFNAMVTAGICAS